MKLFLTLMARTGVVLLLSLSSVMPGALLAADSKSDPMDWPNWRGPEQNRISRETGLVDRWDPAGGEGSNLLWKNPELGGISTPIVMRGKLYTIVRDQPDTPREGEKVVCVDAATGKKLWENRFNVYLSDVPAERVGWSSCVGDPATGRVYALGVCGHFTCIDGDTGKTIWSHSLHEKCGLLSTYGGRTNLPVIHDDLVIISAVVIGWGEMALPAHRFLAFDKNTGEIVWFNGTRVRPEDTTYSTPTVTVLGGQAAMVFGSSDGAIWAFQPRTGKPIWHYQLSRRGINGSPLVVGDTVYAGQAEENTDNTTLGCVAAFKGVGSGDITATNAIWPQIKELRLGKSSPVLVNGRIYAVDDSAKLYIIDAKTGKQVGPKVSLTGTIMRGTPLFADGKLYICTTSAWHVYVPTPNGVKRVHQLRLDEEDEVSGSPIVSHGRIYLATGANLYCIGKPDQKPAATPIPEQPLEEPVANDTRAAQLQIVPAEVLLKPGEKQQFKLRLFNARGQLLSEQKADAKFELQGPGEISRDGQYTTDSAPAHTATIVTAKSGELTGLARIRVVPPLPWKFDFNDITLGGPNNQGEPPITWVGARYRHVVRDVDGERVMVKVNTIPKGTRSQCWMGHPEMSNYTIQSDVRGAINNGKMPDIGLIAQRYTLDLMGASQQLQIRSWTPQLNRFSKTVAFQWEPNKWYTLKFRAAVEDGKAVLRGKVWPRDEKEPAEWTIEATDEAPNVIGSPGLFGNANDAEICLDNITVTANQTSGVLGGAKAAAATN